MISRILGLCAIVLALACSDTTEKAPQASGAGGSAAAGGASTNSSGNYGDDQKDDCCTNVLPFFQTQGNQVPGCADPVIESCVCALDYVCCINAWDDICVQEVSDFGCGPACPAPRH